MFDFIIMLMCFPFEKAERLKHSIEISNAYEFFSGKLSDYRISFIQWNHMFWSILNLCYIVRWEKAHFVWYDLSYQLLAADITQ